MPTKPKHGPSRKWIERAAQAEGEYGGPCDQEGPRHHRGGEVIRRILCPELCASVLREVARDLPLANTWTEKFDLRARLEACARFVEASMPPPKGEPK